MTMSYLDLDRLRDAPLQREPFDYVVVDNFLHCDAVPDLLAAFPQITGHGSYPLRALSYSPLFEELAQELEGAQMRRAIEDKFAIDLEGRPTMITLRGNSDGRDGAIHTDSATKLITVLVYMNREWTAAAGRLRLLRGAADLSDYIAEVSPLVGMMVAFRRSANSYHGHLAHRGQRRSIQLNWVTDEWVVRREISRHRWSARLKALNPLRRHQRLANSSPIGNLLAT